MVIRRRNQRGRSRVLARARVLLLGLPCLAVAALPWAVVGGCSGVDETAFSTVQCPPSDPVTFRPVSAVLERRCGTLDCHGNAARPLRIYGAGGLRRPHPDPEGFDAVTDAGEFDKYYSGFDIPTTEEELLENARSVCGLEPEKTALVVAGDADPSTLTLIRKARLAEKHKGGQLWTALEPGDVCLTSWLQGTPSVVNCTAESSHP